MKDSRDNDQIVFKTLFDRPLTLRKARSDGGKRTLIIEFDIQVGPVSLTLDWDQITDLKTFLEPGELTW